MVSIWSIGWILNIGPDTWILDAEYWSRDLGRWGLDLGVYVPSPSFCILLLDHGVWIVGLYPGYWMLDATYVVSLTPESRVPSTTCQVPGPGFSLSQSKP